MIKRLKTFLILWMKHSLHQMFA